MNGKQGERYESPKANSEADQFDILQLLFSSSDEDEANVDII